MKHRHKLLIAVLTVVCSGQYCTQAQSVIYDAISDLSSATTTSSVPHTYMGQAFNTTADAGSTPLVTSMQLGMFVIGAQNFADVHVRLQFWGTFDPSASGATSVFSNPIGSPIVFDVGPISTAGNAVFFFTLNFGTPVALPGTSNLGIGVNFQSSADGQTFTDNTNLAAAMRAPVGTDTIPVGQNITTGGNVYYRNASGRTDFNFNANDARILTGQTPDTDGLAFSLTAVAAPEPSTWAMLLVGAGMFVCVQRFQRARKA